MAMNVRFHSANKLQHSSAPNTTRKSLNDSSIYCDYCQNTGHTRDKCFCLHGYPEWHKLHGKLKPKPKRLGTIKAAAEVSTQAHNSASSSKSDKTSAYGNVKETSLFSEAQCLQLSKMIQESLKQSNTWSPISSNTQLSGISKHSFSSLVTTNSTSTSDSLDPHIWIVDSGATNHITFHLSLLHNPKVTQSELHLPDGSTVPITHTGTVKLSHDLTLYGVLCVPSFTCNLLSISQLTTHYACSVSFSQSKCIMLDLSLKKVREIGNFQNGLYKIHSSSSASQPSTSDATGESVLVNSSSCYNSSHENAKLWHLRMGHPSVSVLSKL